MAISMKMMRMKTKMNNEYKHVVKNNPPIPSWFCLLSFLSQLKQRVEQGVV